MKTIDSTVNISLKFPITEKKLSEIIKSGKTDDKYLSHLFALFTDVPVSDIMFFTKKNKISLSLLKKYYLKNIKKFYSNTELENVFSSK